MKTYQILSKKLQKLNILDFACIKWVYVFLGLLIASIYHPLLEISIWAYVILMLLTGLPLVLFALSFSGGLIQKATAYLKHNNPSNQVLTIICCASVGLILACLIPTLAQVDWWIYIFIMLLFALKPISVMLEK